ncbi:hypothetical protein L0337_29240 [candidate division KSB1 bacterium]|nr:hypothetical protein [candidate division KSB1 bacterium]
MNYHKIEVDNQVFQVIKSHAEPFIDTPNTVLRRLLLADKILRSQEEKYEDKLESSTALLPSFPKSAPSALVQILEVIWLIKKKGYERTEATNIVARTRAIAPQTVIDKYCRQLGRRADEIDRLLESASLDEFETLLGGNFSQYLAIIREFFRNLQPSSSDNGLETRTIESGQRKERDIQLEHTVKLSVGELLKQEWGEFRIEGDSRLLFPISGKRVLCKYSYFQEEQTRWFWGVSEKHWKNWTDYDHLVLALENQGHDGYSFLLLNSLQAKTLFEKCSESGGAKKMNIRLYKSDGRIHLQEWFEFPLENTIKPLPLA